MADSIHHDESSDSECVTDNYVAQYNGTCNKVIQAQKQVNFAGDSGRCLIG